MFLLPRPCGQRGEIFQRPRNYVLTGLIGYAADAAALRRAHGTAIDTFGRPRPALAYADEGRPVAYQLKHFIYDMRQTRRNVNIFGGQLI